MLTRRRGLQGLGKSCARAFNSKQRGHGDPTPPKIFPFPSQVSLISMECAARTPNPHEGTRELHKLHERIRGRIGTPRSGRTGVFTTQRGYGREQGPTLAGVPPPLSKFDLAARRISCRYKNGQKVARNEFHSSELLELRASTRSSWARLK